MPLTAFETIKDIINHRRAVFPVSYSDRDIPKALLTELLACADAAPTHKRTQPWRFVVFRGKGLPRLADELAALYRAHTPAEQFLDKKLESTREKVLRSGAVIAIVAAYSGVIPQWEELAATACSVQNLWLAASAAGIGGYWSSPGSISHIGEFLGLAANEECLGFFYMGYHDEPPRTPSRRPLAEKVRWEEE